MYFKNMKSLFQSIKKFQRDARLRYKRKSKLINKKTLDFCRLLNYINYRYVCKILNTYIHSQIYI